MTYGGSTHGGAPYGSATVTATQSQTSPVLWRLLRDETEVETAVYDLEVEISANPFGNYAVFKIDDTDGTKFDRYPRGTRVDATYSTSGGFPYTERFTGYVVERRELDQSGADALEVEAYTFDQFLRNNKVTNDQSGKDVVAALEDIIQTDTPVTWDAANVTVGDPQQLTRSYRGEPVETAIRDIAFKSESEEFGVNDDLEFFFRPRESEHIDRGIDDTQWFNYDIPELGKEVRNEVEVWFDGGDRSVIVDDGQDKLDLQNALGLPDPGTQRAEINRPDITTIADAEAEGRKYLQFRNETLSGTVTTYGLFDASPGDTIDIEISERGIDGEFRIAAINYQWGADQTTLTIVEKRGEQDEVLFRLNEAVERLELSSADRDAPSNRITTTQANAIITPTVDVAGKTPPDTSTSTSPSGGYGGSTLGGAAVGSASETGSTQETVSAPDSVKIVNMGLNAVRDAWAGGSIPDVDTITVGSDGSGLSRANTDLVSQTDSASVSQSLPDAKSVAFSATLTQAGVEEIGLETASGTLVARAVFDAPVDIDGTVEWTLTVSNDASTPRSVFTDAGQTAVRDILADNSPELPNNYRYGTGTSAVSESDTSLDSATAVDNLDRTVVQIGYSAEDWSRLVDIGDETPAETSAAGLRSINSAWFGTTDDLGGGPATTEDPGLTEPWDDADVKDYSISSPPETRHVFTPGYTVPAENLGIAVRIGGDWPNGILVTVDGNDYFESAGGISSSTFGWYLLGGDDANLSGTYTDIRQTNATGYQAGDLDSQTTVDFNQAGSTSGASNTPYLDCIYVFDDRFEYTFDNDLSGAKITLDGPEEIPRQQTFTFPNENTPRVFDFGSIESDWNDTSNGQFLEISNDGGNTWVRASNTDTLTNTFSGDSNQIRGRVALSRYATNAGEAPATGDTGQEVDNYDLIVNTDVIVPDGNGIALTTAIISPGPATGDVVSESGIHSGNQLLTRHRFAGEEILADQTLRSADTTAFRNPD